MAEGYAKLVVQVDAVIATIMQNLKQKMVLFTSAPCISSIKNAFIGLTDAPYYKSVEMLKQFKVITLAPTCFSSRRNHHQRAVLCLAKTTDMIFFCACRYGLSQCNGGIPAC
jgi:hypothetical protein